MYSWICMLIAILSEVMGTLAMKYGQHAGHYLIGMMIMYLMLIISYSALAIAIKKIPLALAYGAWESLGLVLIVVFSYFLFGESLGIIKLIATAFIVFGIVLMEIGIKPKGINNAAN